MVRVVRDRKIKRMSNLEDEEIKRRENISERKFFEGGKEVTEEEFKTISGKGGEVTKNITAEQNKELELSNIKKTLGLSPEQLLRPEQVNAYRTAVAKLDENERQAELERLRIENERVQGIEQEQKENAAVSEGIGIGGLIPQGGFQLSEKEAQAGAKVAGGIAAASTLALGSAIPGFQLLAGFAISEVKNLITGKGDIANARQSISNFGQAAGKQTAAVELGANTYSQGLSELNYIEADLLKTEREIQKMKGNILLREKAVTLMQDIEIQKQQLLNERIAMRNAALKLVAEQSRNTPRGVEND